jgi:hypothetical protein
MTLILLGTAQTDAKVGKALKHVIQSGTESLAAYLRLCISRGELRSDLPPETSAQMILSPIIVFFIRHRDLPQTDWDRLVRGFSADMLEVWFRGAQA